MNRHSSILSTIGHTPVVRINRLSPPGVNLWAKLEAFNPMGSVKDRLALGVIEAAERAGELKPGQTVVETTSGNTGIGLAMVCAAKGYPLVIVMGENFSIERRRLMRFLGAKVVLTPAAERGTGMLKKINELVATHGWFWTRQFDNEANADIHSRTTAVELLEDFADLRLDYWVTGFGTGGTFKGVARVLRERSPETRIIVCEPDNSQLLGSKIAQARKPDGSVAASHPVARPHVVQGWGPDFIPKLAEDAANAGLYDEVRAIDGGEAMRLARELAVKEGIFCGVSAGATLAGALAVARDAKPGSNIVFMVPDTGERYLSTLLFEDIPTEMTEEEWAISRSTPSVRFDIPGPPPPPVPDTAVDAEAAAFVAATIADKSQPVVMFAHKWCEFCMSLRKYFAHAGIPFLAIDMDAVEYAPGGRGMKIRLALAAQTRMMTVPQVFIGGEFIGGAMETLTAAKDGSLAKKLGAVGITPKPKDARDPATFLPVWLQPRG
jgi:cysteine synthase A